MNVTCMQAWKDPNLSLLLFCFAENEKPAAQIVDVEPYKVKDLWIELEVMSPVSIPGSYSITVTLYDGGEPVHAAGSSSGVRVQSAFRVWDLHQSTCTIVKVCACVLSVCPLSGAE